jgi:hypothetical protein
MKPRDFSPHAKLSQSRSRKRLQVENCHILTVKARLILQLHKFGYQKQKIKLKHKHNILRNVTN